MKKTLFYLAAASAILAGCAKTEIAVNDGPISITDIPSNGFVCQFAVNDGSKTTIGQTAEDRYDIFWEEGDIIKVTSGSTEWDFYADRAGDYAVFTPCQSHSSAEEEAFFATNNFSAKFGSWESSYNVSSNNADHLPMEAVCDASRTFAFVCTGSVLAVTMPDGVSADKFEVYKKGTADHVVTLNGSVKVFYVPVAAGDNQFTFKAYNGATKIGELDMQKSVKMAAKTIYPFNFAKTLYVKSSDTSKTYDLDNFSGDYYVKVLDAITETVTINAPATGSQPANIYIDAMNNKVDKLVVNTPQSHVEIENGNSDSVTSITSKTTFVIKPTYTINTKLFVEAGGVIAEGKTDGSRNVAAIEIANTVANQSEVTISIAPVSQGDAILVTNKVVSESGQKPITIVGTEDTDFTIVEDQKTNVNIEKRIFNINGKYFGSLSAAILEVKDGETITLMENVADGIGVFAAKGSKTFTVDFAGYTYTVKNNAVGSTGTTTQGFHIEEGNTVTFKNGTINVASGADNIKMLIQNYANLTLDGITLDGTNLVGAGTGRYVVSNNCGYVEFKGVTSIISADGDVAFDVCKYSSYEAPVVVWNSTGNVNGVIELSGGTFKLAKNLCVNTNIVSTCESTLDLGGMKLYNTEDFWNADKKLWSLISVRSGELTIDGSGSIEATTTAPAGKIAECYGIDCKDGNVVIKNATVKGNCSAVYVLKGTATIEGGLFSVEPWEGKYVYTLNCNDNNYKASPKTANIIVKGGSFYKFDPANNAAEGTGTNFLAPGYKSTQSGDVYTVTKAGNVAKIGDTDYATFADAVAAVQDDQTITLLCDIEAAGLSIDTKKTFTVDFAGYTYTSNKPGAGSAGTETQAFQLLKDQTITFKNGTMDIAENNKDFTWEKTSEIKGIARLIQNYASLTLDNMVVDGTNIAHNGKTTPCYVISNNCGTIEYKGETTIKAVAGDYAFDVYNYNNSYYTAPVFTWNSTGVVEGIIEIDGCSMTLSQDLNINTNIVTKNTSVINLGGNKIYNSVDFWNTDKKIWSLISVNSGNLTINDEGSIEATITNDHHLGSTEAECYGIDVKNGKLLVKQANVKGNCSAIYVLLGEATIEGGTYTAVGYDNVYTLNCKDNNYKASPKTANIIVKGGSFYKFDPANNAAEGAGTNFLAPGYTSSKDGDNYVVQPIS